MNFDELVEKLDIYEVDKEDYESYLYRLPKNEIMKTTPREGYVFYKDSLTQQYICGTLSEDIMGMKCTRFFIFEFLPEERLGKELVIKEIIIGEDEYKELLEKLANGKNFDITCEG